MVRIPRIRGPHEPNDPDEHSRADAEARKIIERIERGERDLAGVLYQQYSDRLYAYLCSALDDRSSAEDVTHQVFEAMLHALSRGELQAVVSFRSWLFAVARNRAADHRRKHDRVALTAPAEMRRRDSREQSHDLSWIFPPDVAAALRRLPPRQREVVLLRYVGDFDLSGIADIIGVSEVSVRQAHRRALASLRDRLSAAPAENRTRRRPLAMCEYRAPARRLSGFHPATGIHLHGH